MTLDTTANELSVTLNGNKETVACTVSNGSSIPYGWTIGRRGTKLPELLGITMPMLFNEVLSDAENAILLGAGNPVIFDTLPTSIKDKCVGAWELSSNDNSAVDLTGISNGTKENGVTSDGQGATFKPYVAP